MQPFASHHLPLTARRTFRLAAVTGLALVVGYGSGASLPYLAPLLAFFLAVKPAVPVGPKQLVVLALALGAILSLGILVAPLVEHYPPVGLGLVAMGLIISSTFSIGGEKAAVGTLLAAGLTLVSAMGVFSLALAQALVGSLVVAVIIAVLAQWVVWPLFPESSRELPSHPVNPTMEAGNLRRRALQAVVIIMPAYLFLLTNPTGNTPIMMKSIVLAQTGSVTAARIAARELLGATFLGGCLAIGIWFGLKLAPNLWMFALWITLMMIWIGGKLYLPHRSQFSTQFWIDTTVSCLILVGAAVGDSANGKDPYMGFLFRFGLFTLVSVYAWVAFLLLNRRGQTGSNIHAVNAPVSELKEV